MSVITSGKTFANGEQLSADKLNLMLTGATFSNSAVDLTSTLVDSNGSIVVRDGGISTAKLADGSVTATKIAANAVADMVYPVGAIFTTVNNYADSAAVVSAIGGTTWVRFGAGRVLVGQDSSDTDFDTAEETGGAKTHTLTESEMPAHTHGVQVTQRVTSDDAAGGSRVLTANRNITTATIDITGMTAKSTGGGQSHNNLQPYIVVYMWKRTA